MRMRCTALRTPSDATSNETPRTVSVVFAFFFTSFFAGSARPAPPPTTSSIGDGAVFFRSFVLSITTETLELALSSFVTSS